MNENEVEEVGMKEKWESRKLLCKLMVIFKVNDSGKVMVLKFLLFLMLII